jgi:hypothetical protein
MLFFWHRILLPWIRCFLPTQYAASHAIAHPCCDSRSVISHTSFPKCKKKAKHTKDLTFGSSAILLLN